MAADRYRDDPYWKHKPLTPQQLLIQDVGLETLIPGSPARLELREVPPSNLYLSTPSPRKRSEKSSDATIKSTVLLRKLGATRTEQQKLADLQEDYGWMQQLRMPMERDDREACRWIHVSSKYPESLHGVLLGLSDWSQRPEDKLDALRQLDRCIYDNERFSKHGKFFSPFVQSLTTSQSTETTTAPLLVSIPFLDWTRYPGPYPPLRFNIDPREAKTSSKSSSHPLRSLLQHYYRLEDTTDRDRTQVFSRHRPWYGDREIDLKVRQWYGHFPTGLVVDEMWILVIDEKHIVTFSSNQTWKARWPPLQLASRISDVSFRRIRDNFFSTDRKPNYTAFTHAISCVHGAVGMIHRGFWTDMPLPCTDRYGGYLSHLQFRLHRSPNTKLVRDLLQIQDELNIVLQVTRGQEGVIVSLQKFIGGPITFLDPDSTPFDSPAVSPARASFRGRSRMISSASGDYGGNGPLGGAWAATSDGVELAVPAVSDRRNTSYAIPRLNYAFRPPNPLDEVLDLLRREFDDLKELRNSSNELATRTVQLVNIRLEDHGRAIIVFTLVTVVFLPLSFISSYYGMNVDGIRNTNHTQSVFWTWASVTAIGVLIFSSLLAFYGGSIVDRLKLQLEKSGWRPMPT